MLEHSIAANPVWVRGLGLLFTFCVRCQDFLRGITGWGSWINVISTVFCIQCGCISHLRVMNHLSSSLVYWIKCLILKGHAEMKNIWWVSEASWLRFQVGMVVVEFKLNKWFQFWAVFLPFVKPWPVVSYSDHWFRHVVLCRGKCAVVCGKSLKMTKVVNFLYLN